MREWDCPKLASLHYGHINAHFQHFGCRAGSVKSGSRYLYLKESKSWRASAMKQKAPNNNDAEIPPCIVRAALGGCQ